MKSVCEIVGSAYIHDREDTLTICDEVYQVAIGKMDVADEKEIKKCCKNICNARTPSGHSSQIGDKKAHELLVKLGVLFAGLTDDQIRMVNRQRYIRREG